jgi:hypothetical protein
MPPTKRAIDEIATSHGSIFSEIGIIATIGTRRNFKRKMNKTCLSPWTPSNGLFDVAD